MTTGSAIPMPLALIEVRQLVALIDQFLELLQDSEIGQDSALDRLTPSAFPADPEASAEFAEATAADLLDRRAADARVMRAGLQPFLEGHENERRDLLVPASEIDAWMRTLTALRLILATRLGVVRGDEHEPEDPRFGVYDWLGYRLDLLIEAADALDGP